MFSAETTTEIPVETEEVVSKTDDSTTVVVTEAKEFVHLTDKNFEQYRNQSDPLLVEFYVPQW